MKEEGQNAAVGTKNFADRKIGGKTRDIDKTSARYTVSCRGLPLQPFRATKMVEATGFEPTTSWSRTKRATKLRYASNGEYYIKPNALLQAILSRCNKNPARRERGEVRKTIRGGPVSRVLSSAVIYLRPPSPTGSSVIHGSARTGSPYEQSPNLHRTGFTWHGALPSRR